VSSARAAGAHIVALVNAEDSPLAQLADDLIPLCAGTERSVAATKSYITSLAAIVQLVANWTRDAQLAAALQQAPELLERAWQLDWSAAVTHLTAANNLYVIGRGLGLAIAQEAALKFKETCGLHAEAVSAAELRHGPMALVGAAFRCSSSRRTTRAAPASHSWRPSSPRAARRAARRRGRRGRDHPAHGRSPSGHRTAAVRAKLLPHGERAVAGARS